MRSVVPNDQRLSNGASAMVVTAPNMLANHDHFLTMAMILPSVAGLPEAEAIATSRTQLLRKPSDVAERSMSMAAL